LDVAVTISASDNPRHIAIVMDGNGRWAQQRGKPRIFGHRKGVETVRNIVDACGHRRIPYLTLYAFSSENWNRPKEEVRLLSELLFSTLENEALRLHENGIRLHVIGDLKPFGKKISSAVTHIRNLTRDNNQLNLTIAINYGGRWDLVNDCQKLLDEVCNNSNATNGQITEQSLAQHLSTAVLPDLDLFIRTGGELRVSNFLLWQLAYSELYFTETLWPEFDEKSLDDALESYRGRQRRFGSIQRKNAEQRS
jgi:undecaprenyl diphosphate synthase